MTTITLTDAQALFDRMCAAWDHADAAGIAATYAPEGRLVIPFGDVFDGRDAVEAGFTEHFGGILAGSTSTIRVDDVRPLAGGEAFVDATQDVTGPMPTLHVSAVIRLDGDEAYVVECRPYAFLPVPQPARA